MSVEAMTTHPVLRAVDRIEEALDLVADCDPAYLPAQAHRDAMLRLTEVGDRLETLRARVVHAASGPDGVAQSDGARTGAAWLAARTRSGFGSARRTERLGEAISDRWHRVGAALQSGLIRLEQARVIIKALDALPTDQVDRDTLALAEERLVELAQDHDPRRLEILGDKILEVIAPDTYDDLERQALERAQRRASAATRLTFSRRGDGSTDIRARVPEHVAARLKTMLEAWTSPRHDRVPGALFDQRDPASGARLPHDRLLGEAFCAYLEAADPERMPVHGGAATRIVITVDLEALRSALGAAQIVTSGDDDLRLSPGQVRRLACQADLVPAVLGGDSEILDLGRSRRLFTPAQRLAKMQTQRTCTADGCTVPATWCEAHHARDPWSRGGTTDLADLQFLCPWHHQRAHDPTYTTQQHPDGSARFHRRT